MSLINEQLIAEAEKIMPMTDLDDIDTMYRGPECMLDKDNREVYMRTHELNQETWTLYNDEDGSKIVINKFYPNRLIRVTKYDKFGREVAVEATTGYHKEIKYASDTGLEIKSITEASFYNLKLRR